MHILCAIFIHRLFTIWRDGVTHTYFYYSSTKYHCNHLIHYLYIYFFLWKCYFVRVLTFAQVLSLSLACFSVLMLPLDVGNGATDGGFPMGTLWLIVFITMAVLIVVVIPFATFYYEGDEYDETGWVLLFQVLFYPLHLIYCDDTGKHHHKLVLQSRELWSPLLFTLWFL